MVHIVAIVDTDITIMVIVTVMVVDVTTTTVVAAHVPRVIAVMKNRRNNKLYSL